MATRNKAKGAKAPTSKTDMKNLERLKTVTGELKNTEKLFKEKKEPYAET